MSSNDEKIREQIAALRVAYVHQLPARLNEIYAVLELWLKSKNAADLFTFYRLTHNLAGSGAVYGFMEITEKARAVEHVVAPVVEDKIQATPADVETLRVRLAALEETLRRTTCA